MMKQVRDGRSIGMGITLPFECGLNPCAALQLAVYVALLI